MSATETSKKNSAGTGGYVYPTVRSEAWPTAHPSAEVWPAARVPIAGGRTGRPHRWLQPVASRAGLADDAGEQFKFEALQRRMATVEAAGRLGRTRSLVIVPSRPLESWDEGPAKAQAYEERLLCSLLELRDPNVRMTYVTSSMIAPAIVDYYLGLLPRRMRRSARSRLTLVALGDSSVRQLSEKLLARPQLLDRIRRSLGAHAACHLVPHNTSELERDLALALDIPMYGSDPRHAYFGTKSGCRELFADAGVPHPAGTEGITSAAGAVRAITELRAARPDLGRLVMKCNEGVAGEGNAIIDLTDLPAPGCAHEVPSVAERIQRLTPEAPGVTVAAFLAKFAQRGGVIEEWIVGSEIESPSVQLQITPAGEVIVVSTHDQILGGPTGQRYLGCRFPAARSYASTISVLALRVGRRLAEAGVIGRCAIDFVVARDGTGAWSPFAIELNLRKGGTTHPFETLASLTGGTYDPDRGAFITPTGQCKHYVATDHMEAPQLRALGHNGVLDLARRDGVRFDPIRRVGSVFHMLSSVDELGRTGFTAIADSSDESDALFARVQEELLREADLRPPPLVPLPSPVAAAVAA